MFRCLSRLSVQLLKKCSYSTPNTKVTDFKNEIPILQKLSAEFGDISFIAPLIKNEEIVNKNFEEWKDRIHIMKSFNFNDGECFLMISRYPKLLEIPYKTLENSARQWLACEIEVESYKHMLMSQPQLLDIDYEEIRKRVPYLNSLYKSPKSLVSLLINNPNIMFEDWKYVLEKINYLLKEKGVERRELLQSKALSKSLALMQLRFSILEKCGLYKRPSIYPHKMNKFDRGKLNNPHLKFLIDNNDRLFATKTAGISLEEYQVCKDLFELFGNDEKSIDDDDDDDDDNTHYNSYNKEKF